MDGSVPSSSAPALAPARACRTTRCSPSCGAPAGSRIWAADPSRRIRFGSLWVDMLGLRVTGNFVSERENVDEDICAIGSGVHTVEVDLMQPLDPEKKPAVHTTPLNHVGLWVDDLPRAVDWMSANGVRFAPGGIRKGAAGHDICFIHPKGNEQFPIGGEGVLIELVQAPPEVIAGLG